MSQLYKSILGAPSGKVGQLVFRMRRGKVYIYTAPIPYQPTPTPEFVAHQNKFIFLRKMAAATAKDHLLKSLWNESLLPGGVGFERQMSINFPIYKNDSDISLLKLVPSEELFQTVIQSYSYENNFLVVTVSTADSGITESDEKIISPHGIMLLSGVKNGEPVYCFVPLSAKGELFTGADTYTFSLPLDYETISGYQSASFILCMIIRDIHGVPLKYSVNLAGVVEVL